MSSVTAPKLLSAVFLVFMVSSVFIEKNNLVALPQCDLSQHNDTQCETGVEVRPPLLVWVSVKGLLVVLCFLNHLFDSSNNTL